MNGVDASDSNGDTNLAAVDLTPHGGVGGSSGTLDRGARIRAAMIAEMIRESGRLRVSPFIVVAVLGTVFVERAPHWPTIVLVVGAVLFTFAGDRLRKAFEAAGDAPETAEAWGLRYVILSGVVGLIWGPCLAGYFDPDSFPHQAFLALLTFGSLFAAIVHRALYPPAFIALAVPSVLPLIAMLALSGRELSMATAALGVLGLAVLFGWMRILNRRFRESFTLRFQNTDLIERLEAAHRSAENARQAAEAGDRTKSEFLATISHELRTPMNGIIGMTGLMQGTRLTPQQRSYADIIRESADALLSLINDILDLTKLESGRIELDDSPFELAQTVEGAVGLMAERAQSRGLELASFIAPDTPDIITADAGRLRQVLLNLLSNAIKFTEEGSVTLTVGPAPEARATLRMEVTDTGIGIADEVIPRLFRPFSQAGGISRRFGGTGLGLAICRRLIDAMGGEITVRSEEGRGSTFRVDLPIRSGKRVRRQERLDGTDVVFLGPPGVVRDHAARYAEGWGARILFAETPADALQELRSAGAGAAAVADWRAKGGAGAFARQVRADSAIRDTRLVLTLPVGVVEAVTEDEDALFDARLLQPVRRDGFHRALFEGTAETEDDHPRPRRRTTPAPGTRLRVLVVDDVAVNQKLAASIVEMSGHEAVVAGSGREALQALRTLPYDMVLMDVEMPEMDGLSATRAIRQMPGAAGAVPIVAMTAHPGDEYVDRCMDAGMNAFLAKPLDASELISILQERAQNVSPGATAGSGPAEVVQRLEGALGLQAAREMADAFLTELETWLAELEQASGEDDSETVWQTAHRLKGAALNMGLRGLADSAASLSSAAGAGEQELQGRVAETVRQATLARRAIAEELNRRKD